MLYVCTVFDTAADCFSTPFFVPSKGLAIRSFSDEVNRNAPDNTMFAHYKHFTLFCLGNFDPASGVFDLFSDPEKLISGESAKVADPI